MDTRIKERLVGAIALVAIVVIVVPELLTGPHVPAPAPPPALAPAAQHSYSIDLTAGERGAIARSPAPAAPAPEAATAVPGAVDGPATAPGASGNRAGAVSAADAPPAAAPAPTPAAVPPKPAATATVATEVHPLAQAPSAAINHVPAAAPAAAAPAAAPRPTVPVAGAEGWVVQLGSFASKDNAESLAKGLRAKGYRAFVSEFRGSGRVLYRVRVGPEQDRARAETIAARLAHEGHHGSVAPQP